MLIAEDGLPIAVELTNHVEQGDQNVESGDQNGDEPEDLPGLLLEGLVQEGRLLQEGHSSQTYNLHQSNKGTILTISIIIIEDFQKCDNHHLHIACNCLQWHFSLQPGDFSPLDRCSMKIRCCLIVDRNILLSWNKISRFKHKTILNVNVQPGEVRAAPLVFLLGQPRLSHHLAGDDVYGWQDTKVRQIRPHVQVG